MSASTIKNKLPVFDLTFSTLSNIAAIFKSNVNESVHCTWPYLTQKIKYKFDDNCLMTMTAEMNYYQKEHRRD